MTNQTQDYITLKPIAERFKEVTMSISDDEIKAIIKEELREQIRNQVNFGSTIGQWVDDMLEDDESVINAPITYQGNAVGVITDIDDTYVFGILRTDILPEISVDTHKVVSFEIHSSQKDNKSSDVEIRCNNVGMKAGSWQCNFCLMKK